MEDLNREFHDFFAPCGAKIGDTIYVRKPVYAATMEDARRLHQQREEEIKAQAKRERDEELSALCRLLDLKD